MFRRHGWVCGLTQLANTIGAFGEDSEGPDA
jgi:hypothetical protein